MAYQFSITKKVFNQSESFEVRIFDLRLIACLDSKKKSESNKEIIAEDGTELFYDCS